MVAEQTGSALQSKVGRHSNLDHLRCTSNFCPIGISICLEPGAQHDAAWSWHCEVLGGLVLSSAVSCCLVVASSLA
jgi:hypothetical protein